MNRVPFIKTAILLAISTLSFCACKAEEPPKVIPPGTSPSVAGWSSQTSESVKHSGRPVCLYMYTGGGKAPELEGTAFLGDASVKAELAKLSCVKIDLGIHAAANKSISIAEKLVKKDQSDKDIPLLVTNAKNAADEQTAARKIAEKNRVDKDAADKVFIDTIDAIVTDKTATAAVIAKAEKAKAAQIAADKASVDIAAAKVPAEAVHAADSAKTAAEKAVSDILIEKTLADTVKTKTVRVKAAQAKIFEAAKAKRDAEILLRQKADNVAAISKTLADKTAGTIKATNEAASYKALLEALNSWPPSLIEQAKASRNVVFLLDSNMAVVGTYTTTMPASRDSFIAKAKALSEVAAKKIAEQKSIQDKKDAEAAEAEKKVADAQKGVGALIGIGEKDKDGKVKKPTGEKKPVEKKPEIIDE